VNSAEQEPEDPRVVGGLQILADQLTKFIEWQTAR
jgi:hypothetical protein